MSEITRRLICKWHSILAILCCFIFTLSATTKIKAQSAEQIVKQYIKAIGGERAIKSITSWSQSGTIARRNDQAFGSYRAWAMNPTFYSFSFDVRGIEQRAGFNGKSSWRRDARDGLRTLTGNASDDFQAEALYRNHLLISRKRERAAITYIGPASINGQAVQTVLLTTLRDVKIKMYFDANSHLLIREELPAGDETKIFDYRDYRVIGGVREPFIITLSEGGETYDIKIEKIAHNQLLERARFDFPRPLNEPMPDINALLVQVRDHQQQMEQLYEQYGYTETTTSHDFDKQGKIKEKESETYQITFYRGHRVRRLVAKNGQPLTAAEQTKEDRRIEQMIKDLDQGKKIDIPYNQRRLKIADLLRAASFLNPRKERFRGRDVIVFDIEPNQNFKPDNLGNRFINELTGSIWIDAADLQVARVEFQLIGAFKVGGGFFAMQPGSRFVVEQDRFNNEIWMPTYSEVTIAAKAMLFVKLNIIETVRYSNHVRFNTMVEEKINLPQTKRPLRP